MLGSKGPLGWLSDNPPLARAVFRTATTMFCTLAVFAVATTLVGALGEGLVRTETTPVLLTRRPHAVQCAVDGAARCGV